MNKCYISITFDDGREDNYRNAFEILKKHNLKATIYAISGYIDGTYKHKLASSNGPISLEALKEMKNQGNEISLHGDMHITEYLDLIRCECKMKSWGLVSEKYGFSMPHSDETKLADKKTNEKLKKDFQYVRVGKSHKCMKFMSKVFYLIYLFTKLNLFYYLYNKNSIIDITDIDWYHLVSVPVKMYDKSKTLKSFIKRSAKNNKWIIFMFHSILKKSDKMYNNSKWGYDYDEFDKFCECLEQLVNRKKIVVIPVISVKEEMIRNVKF